MIGIARFCMRHRIAVIVFWFLLLVGTQIAISVYGDDYRSNFSLPDTDSERAFELLGANFPDLSGAEAQVVFHARSGTIEEPAIRAEVEGMLLEAQDLPHVSDIDSPYANTRGQTISDDETIGFALVKFNQDLGDLDRTAANRLVDLAKSIETDQLEVELSGDPILLAVSPPGPGSSTGISILAAIVVLLISFGSLLAMGLPIVTALLGLVSGTAIIGLVSHLMDFAEFSQELAIMIGLGVGVDYALFILTRYRDIYHERGGHNLRGSDQFYVKELAIERAMDSSGRAVVFAGITVIIALMGMFALGFEFMNGLAVAMSIGVFVVLLASITILPALLAIFGTRVGRLSRRARRREEAGEVRVGFWERCVGFVQRHALIVAVLSTLLVLALAVPALNIRLGSSDSSNDNPSLTTRQAYDLLGTGFGLGFNAPLQLAVALPKVDDAYPANQMAKALESTEGIASVEKPRLSPGRTAASIIAYPSTSPQSAETTELVKHLRKEVVPTIETNTGAKIYIGGGTAGNIDFTKLLSEKIFFFIGIVVLLSALLLLVVFRSLVIPIQAAIMNLMSIGAALGLVQLAFQEGLLPGMEPGPIDSFLPVMVFAIVFGLSMDYEVFLVSRIHEEWTRTGNHADSIRIGLARTGRVVTAAAAVMIVVFSSFIALGERVPAMFGMGLAAAVLVDAFIIRVLLLPAVLHLAGPATWWFPHWLDRMLPSLAVEPHEDSEGRPPWPLWIKLFWATIVALLIAGSTVWIVLADDEDDDPKIEKVLAERGTVLAKYTANGKVVDPGELAVNFPNGGGGQRIVSVEVEMGDQVQEGDVLAIVESADARAQLRAAKAELSGADVGRRSGSAQRAQSRSSVKAARQALNSSKDVTRTTDRSLNTAVKVSKDSEKQAKKVLKQAKKGKKQACSGPRQTPEAQAACAAAGEQVKLAKQGVFQAENAVKGAKRERASAKSQQDSAVTAAKSGVKSARKADRLSRASTSGSGPPISAAEIAVQNAQRNLNRTKLRAPAEGKIVSVGGRSSEYVGSSAAGSSGAPAGADAATAAGAPPPSGFVILTNVDALEFEGHFSQADASELRPGQPAEVALPALDGQELKGYVASISPSGNQSGEDVTFRTLIELRKFPGDLKVGQTGQVEVTTGKAKNVVYIPSAAVQTSDGRSVAATWKGGVPRLRRVQVGVEGKLSTEIQSGIKAGEKVIVGEPRVKD